MKRIIYAIYSNLDLIDLDRNSQVLDDYLNSGDVLSFAPLGDEKRRRLYL